MATLQAAIDASLATTGARTFQNASRVIIGSSRSISNAIRSVDQVFAGIGANAQAARTQFSSLSRTTAGLSRRLNGLQASANASGAGLANASAGAGNLNSRLSGVGRSLRATGAGLRRTSGGLTTLGASASVASGGVGQLVSAFAGLQVIISTLSNIAEFDRAIRTVGAVSGATAEDIAQLTQVARDLGEATEFTATQASQGFVTLARAGFDTADSISVLGQALNLATAQGIGFERAADITATAIRQFGFDADQATRVVDVFNRTANSSNTTVDQLNAAFRNVAPNAATLGISIEELARSVGVLGDSGIRGTKAGTDLRGILLALQVTTPRAQREIEGLGLSLAELSPATNSLSTIFRRLSDAVNSSEVSATQASRAFGIIFGRRPVASATILTAGVERLDSVFNQLGNSAAQTAAEIRESLTIQVDLLTSAISELQLSLADAGAFVPFLQGATNAVRAVDTLVDSIREASGESENFTRVAGVLGSTAGILGIVTAANLAVRALQLLRVALVSTGIGAIAVAIGLAIGALIEFQDTVIQVNGRFTTLGAAAEGSLAPLLEITGTFISDVGPSVVRTIGTVAAAFGTVFDAAVDVGEALSSAFGTDLTTVLRGAVGLLGNLSDRIIGGIRALSVFTSELVTSARAAFELVRIFSNPLEIAANPAAFLATLDTVEAQLENTFDRALSRANKEIQDQTVNGFQVAFEKAFDALANFRPELPEGALNLEVTPQFNFSDEILRTSGLSTALATAQGGLADAFGDTIAAAGEQAAAYAALDESIGSQLNSLDSQISALRGELDPAYEESALSARLFEEAQRAGVAPTEELTQVIEESVQAILERRAQIEQLQATIRAQRAEESFRTSLEETTQSLELQVLSLQATNSAKRTAVIEQELLNDAQRQGIVVSEDLSATIAEQAVQFDLLQSAALELRETNRVADDLNQTFRDGLGETLTALTDRSRDFGETAEQALRQVLSRLQEILVIQPLLDSLFGNPNTGTEGALSGLFQNVAGGVVGTDAQDAAAGLGEETEGAALQAASTALSASFTQGTATAANFQTAAAAVSTAASAADISATGLTSAGATLNGAAAAVNGAAAAISASAVQLQAAALAAAGAGAVGGGVAGSSTAGQLGGVVSSTAFQNGTVFGQQTFFPLSQNQSARVGEAGKEGLLPLDINSRGQLSVNTTGEGQGNSVGSVNFNITTQDADSFRRSRRQLESDARRIVNDQFNA